MRCSRGSKKPSPCTVSPLRNSASRGAPSAVVHRRPYQVKRVARPLAKRVLRHRSIVIRTAMCGAAAVRVRLGSRPLWTPASRQKTFSPSSARDCRLQRVATVKTGPWDLPLAPEAHEARHQPSTNAWLKCLMRPQTRVAPKWRATSRSCPECVTQGTGTSGAGEKVNVWDRFKGTARHRSRESSRPRCSCPRRRPATHRRPATRAAGPGASWASACRTP
jgi:hypothetical protein